MRLFVFIIVGILVLGNPIKAFSQIPSSQEQIQLTFAPVVEQVAPAVVNIYAKKKIKESFRHPFFSDPMFNQFFGGNTFGRGMRERVQDSLGSGFIVNKSGLVVTNAHVIKGASEIVVHLQDGRQYEAEISVIDTPSDIALLKIKNPEGNLPFLNFENSDDLAVGDLVLAIGNPFGVGQTVTSGIVSAVARSASNINDFSFFIQTDAAINPGNSGGPLVSLNGNVVGVNTAIYSRDGGSLGIGFAIPSEMALAVIAAEEAGQVGQKGSIVRAWVGAQGQNITSDIANSLNLKTTKGVLISNVHPKGPAYKAGLRQGDLVTTMNGRDVKDAQELLFRFATVPLNSLIELNTIRNGKPRVVKFKAIAPVEDPPRIPTELSGKNPLAGNIVVNVSPAVEIEYKLKNQSDGVIVVDAAPRRSFGMLPLQPGDGIIGLNGERVTSVKQLTQLLQKYDNKRQWAIVIRRNGRDQTLFIR